MHSIPPNLWSIEIPKWFVRCLIAIVFVATPDIANAAAPITVIHIKNSSKQAFEVIVYFKAAQDSDAHMFLETAKLQPGKEVTFTLDGLLNTKEERPLLEIRGRQIQVDRSALASSEFPLTGPELQKRTLVELNRQFPISWGSLDSGVAHFSRSGKGSRINYSVGLAYKK